MKDLQETKKEIISFFDDFKEFLMRRNAIDMALGIIIGTAFSKVVSSLVADIIMPPIGLILGGVNFQDLKIVIKPATLKNGKLIESAVTINYGKFIQVLIDFIIVAFTVYLVINIINKLIRRKENIHWDQFVNK